MITASVMKELILLFKVFDGVLDGVEARDCSFSCSAYDLTKLFSFTKKSKTSSFRLFIYLAHIFLGSTVFLLIWSTVSFPCQLFYNVPC